MHCMPAGLQVAHCWGGAVRAPLLIEIKRSESMGQLGNRPIRHRVTTANAIIVLHTSAPKILVRNQGRETVPKRPLAKDGETMRGKN